MILSPEILLGHASHCFAVRLRYAPLRMTRAGWRTVYSFFKNPPQCITFFVLCEVLEGEIEFLREAQKEKGLSHLAWKAWSRHDRRTKVRRVARARLKNCIKMKKTAEFSAVFNVKKD